MSGAETSGEPAVAGVDATVPHGEPSKSGFWHKLKSAIIRTENELSVAKGLVVVSLAGTLIGAYFQNLSAYDAKVAAQAKQDLDAATQNFAEASAALSVPLSLQERLVFGYYDAVAQKIDADDSAYVTKSARALDPPYEAAYTTLRQNINILAQKMELYLDWPSDARHDAAMNGPPTEDPINSSAFGTYGFHCDSDLPGFAADNNSITLTRTDGNTKAPKTLRIDWYSAKHNVLAMYYCFYVIHQVMKPLRAWASGSQVDATEQAKFRAEKERIENQLNNQVLRLYAFMGLAMNEIDQIRVKYRPNGYLCSVPGVSGLISYVSRKLRSTPRGWCTPIQTSAL